MTTPIKLPSSITTPELINALEKIKINQTNSLSNHEIEAVIEIIETVVSHQ